jgi:anti-sigma factor RsiW
MMTCCELAELLLDYVNGELPPEQCERICMHMQLCPPCVTYVETYCLTIRLTRRLPCSPLPPQLAQRLEVVLAEIKGKEGGPGGEDETRLC